MKSLNLVLVGLLASSSLTFAGGDGSRRWLELGATAAVTGAATWYWTKKNTEKKLTAQFSKLKDAESEEE